MGLIISAERLVGGAATESTITKFNVGELNMYKVMFVYISIYYYYYSAIYVACIIIMCSVFNWLLH